MYIIALYTTSTCTCVYIFRCVYTFMNWSISFKEVWLEEDIKNVTTRGRGERGRIYKCICNSLKYTDSLPPPLSLSLLPSDSFHSIINR